MCCEYFDVINGKEKSRFQGLYLMNILKIHRIWSNQYCLILQLVQIFRKIFKIVVHTSFTSLLLQTRCG